MKVRTKQLMHVGVSLALGAGTTSISQAQIAAAPGSTTTTQNLAPDASALKAAANLRTGGLTAGFTAAGWEAIAGFGLSLTKGNSDTLLYSADLSLKKSWADVNEIGIEAAGVYGENDEVTTNQFATAAVAYRRTVADPFYLGINGLFQHDKIANLDYRASVIPVLGVYAIKNDTTSLAFETGVGYTWEDQGASDSYASFRAAEIFSHKISDTSSIFQSVQFLSSVEDFGNSSVIAEAGIITQLTDKLSIKTLVRGTYDNQVPEGIDDTDWSIISTLSYALGGADETTTLEDLAAAQTDKGTSDAWQTTALAGVTATGGNSETFLATLNLLTAREWGPNTLGLSVGGTYGEVEGASTANTVGAGANYTRTIAEPFYFGIGSTFLHDDLAAVEYRITANPSLGIYFIKNDTTKFNVEAGPAYVWEEVGGISDSYFAVRGAQGFEHQLTASTKFWEVVEYIGSTDDFNDYLLNGEIGLETAISSNLSLKNFVQITYDNTPSAGLDSTDWRFISALSITF